MLRLLSNSCFGLALGTVFLLNLFEVGEDWIGFAVFCVCLAAILTNFMLVRFLGLGGVGGLSIIFQHLGGSSIGAAFLILLSAGLLCAGVFLAVYADFTRPALKGNKEPPNV